MGSAPIVIGYDGSAGAAHAVRDAGALLPGRAAVVVVVWKAGMGADVLEEPIRNLSLPPAELDVRTAEEIDRAMAERAQALAAQGAEIARQAGFAEAEGLAVAEDVEITVAEAIADVARRRAAAAVVVGAHGHRAGSGELILGRITRDVIRLAPSPALVSSSRPPDTRPAAGR